MKKLLLVVAIVLAVIVLLNTYRITTLQSSENSTSSSSISSNSSSKTSSLVRSENNIMSNNSETSKDTLKYGYPLSRENCVNPTYIRGYSETHHGIDLISSSNEKCEIIAVSEGEVIESGWVVNGEGYQISISSRDNVIIKYSQLSKISVKLGQKINKGDVIGNMGSTGNSIGTHLHLAVYINGLLIDPERIVIIK